MGTVSGKLTPRQRGLNPLTGVDTPEIHIERPGKCESSQRRGTPPLHKERDPARGSPGPPENKLGLWEKTGELTPCESPHLRGGGPPGAEKNPPGFREKEVLGLKPPPPKVENPWPPGYPLPLLGTRNYGNPTFPKKDPPLGKPQGEKRGTPFQTRGVKVAPRGFGIFPALVKKRFRMKSPKPPQRAGVPPGMKKFPKHAAPFKLPRPKVKRQPKPRPLKGKVGTQGGPKRPGSPREPPLPQKILGPLAQQKPRVPQNKLPKRAVCAPPPFREQEFGFPVWPPQREPLANKGTPLGPIPVNPGLGFLKPRFFFGPQSKSKPKRPALEPGPPPSQVGNKWFFPIGPKITAKPGYDTPWWPANAVCRRHCCH